MEGIEEKNVLSVVLKAAIKEVAQVPAIAESLTQVVMEVIETAEEGAEGDFYGSNGYP